MLPAVLLFASVLHWPTPIPGAWPTECKIVDGAMDGRNWWHVSVTLKTPDGTNKIWVFSVREFTEDKRDKVLKQAMLDCHDFMAHYEKQAKKQAK